MIFLKIHYHIISIIKKIFYKIIYGKNVKFGKGVTFRKGFSLAIESRGKVEIAKGCFFNNYCSINAKKEIQIGENTIFGEGVKIYDHNHIFKYKDELIKNQGFKIDSIEIGSNCWIGSNVIILKGVKIGNNVVIGAGEIVKKNIESNKIFTDSKVSDIRLEKRNA